MRGACVGLLYMALGIVCYALMMGQSPQLAAYLADLGMGLAAGGLFGMILTTRKRDKLQRLLSQRRELRAEGRHGGNPRKDAGGGRDCIGLALYFYTMTAQMEAGDIRKTDATEQAYRVGKSL